jgi:hypothetical protein
VDPHFSFSILLLLMLLSLNLTSIKKILEAYDILCDKKISNKLKDKFYRTTIRPAMMYDANCWTTKDQYIQKMSVTEMRMLRWICCHTRRDRIRNNDMRDKLEVAPNQKKLVQHRFWWFGHI